MQWDGDGGIGEEMVMEFGSVGANDDDSPATSAAILSISNNYGKDLGKDTDDEIQSYRGSDNIDSTTTSYGGQTNSGGSSIFIESGWNKGHKQ